MKQGDVVNGYQILTKPATTKDLTAFATKNGEYFFIKMFIQPKYPLPDGPGSELVKQKKLAQCAEFEFKNSHLNSRISPDMLGAGNLVLAREIFRVGSTYYKVCNLVVPSEHNDLTRLNPHQALVVLRTIAMSLRLLHQAGFIHGDLKPPNVIIQESRPGVFVGKVIDFDDGYIVENPPIPSEVIGDPAYYSPELMLYVNESSQVSGKDLTTASDMFSLGLLIHSLLTGELPTFDRAKYPYASMASIDGNLKVDLLKGPMQAWITRLLHVDYRERPLIEDLMYFLIEFTPTQLLECIPSPAELATSRVPVAGIPTSEARPALKGTLRKGSI